MTRYFAYDERDPHGPAMFISDGRIRVASKWENVAGMPLHEAERLQGILSGLTPERLDLFKEALGEMIEELEKLT